MTQLGPVQAILGFAMEVLEMGEEIFFILRDLCEGGDRCEGEC